MNNSLTMKSKKKATILETLKEQGTMGLLKSTLQLGTPFLTRLEQIILKEILIENKTFNDLKASLKLMPMRQQQILNTGIRRMHKIMAEMNEKVVAYDVVKKELVETKNRLAEFETAIKKQNELSPKLKESQNQLIENIGFSARVRNICHKKDIKTLFDLVGYTKKDFSSIRDCGKKCSDEVEVFLLSKGLSWGMHSL